jgi:hypothetical protein
MKKRVIAGIGLLSLAAASFPYGWNYLHTRHPEIKCNSAGTECIFTYNLCVPMPPPESCVKYPFDLAERTGLDTIGMPYPKRTKEFMSVDDMRGEAEERADMIENIRHETDLSDMGINK